MENRNHSTDIIVILTGLTIIGLYVGNSVWIKAAVALGLLSIFSGTVRKVVSVGWLNLGKGLGWINGRILLSIIFYLVLFPLSLFGRRKRLKDMGLTKDGERSSMFKLRNKQFEKEDFEKLW